MKRKTALFISALLISICSFAQNDPVLVKKILEQSNDMAKKFVAQDYQGFLKYTHPSTLKAMGGENMAVKKITEEMHSLAKDGIIVVNITFGIPTKIIKHEGELQCTVPQIMLMHIPTGKVTATTTMLAISNDNGKNWYFLDTANYNHYDMKTLIPTLSDEIVIPERTDPSFEPNEKEDQKSE